MPDPSQYHLVACRKCGEYTAFNEDVLGTRIMCRSCSAIFVAQEYLPPIGSRQDKKVEKVPAMFGNGVRIPIPAPRDTREQIAKALLLMQYSCDPHCKEFFDTIELSISDLSLEEILDLEVGLVLKLTEQHLQHARNFGSSKLGLSLMGYLESHIFGLNQLHHSSFAAMGYNFPIDESLSNIGDYIVHFLRYRPDKGEISIPEVMIIPMVQFIMDLYCSNINKNQEG